MLTDLDSVAPSPRHWSWMKFTLGFLAALLIFLTFIFAYDDKLEPFNDLIPTHHPVPGEKTNGYPFLRARWQSLPEASRKDHNQFIDMVIGKAPWDESLVTKMRPGRENAAADLRAALALPHYLTPPVLAQNDPELSQNSWITKPFRYLAMEAIASGRAGDNKAAMTQLADLHTLAKRHVAGSGSLISLLLGIAMHSVTIVTANDLLELGKLTPTEISTLAEFWKDDLPAAQSWQEAMRSEAAFGRDVVRAVVERDPDLPESFRPKFSWLLLKPNKTINRMSQKIRHVSGIAFKTFPTKSAADSAGWGEIKDTRSKLARNLDANYAGRKLTEGDDSLGKILPGMTNKLLFEPRAMRVSVAIHRWRFKHLGQWPASLDELVPDFLTEIPQDPFNGQPLLWDPVAHVISSVGADWKPNRPKFKEAYSWLSEDHDSPGMRVERPSGSTPPVVTGEPTDNGVPSSN